LGQITTVHPGPSGTHPVHSGPSSGKFPLRQLPVTGYREAAPFAVALLTNRGIARRPNSTPRTRILKYTFMMKLFVG